MPLALDRPSLALAVEVCLGEVFVVAAGFDDLSGSEKPPGLPPTPRPPTEPPRTGGPPQAPQPPAWREGGAAPLLCGSLLAEPPAKGVEGVFTCCGCPCDVCAALVPVNGCLGEIPVFNGLEDLI